MYKLINNHKICLLLSFILLLTTCANAKEVFSNIENIKSFKCKGKRVSGSINEYQNFTLSYTFKNGKLYGSNMHALFKDEARHHDTVYRLKIKDDYITFKERLVKFEVARYITVKINRKSGEFTAEAKNDYNAFYKKASTKGVCSVTK
jgi:hypothetical protein